MAGLRAACSDIPGLTAATQDMHTRVSVRGVGCRNSAGWVHVWRAKVTTRDGVEVWEGRMWQHAPWSAACLLKCLC